MTLASGARLGPYEIQAAVGAGGMGEVYKARDTRLDRTVAIKILSPRVAADPESRARFEREAKAIAGLNHPHICALHDVGDQDGSLFLVMEYVAGETLADRLRKGPLPVEQALSIATEIADALAAAHRQGIIHRDLKPANIMVTRSGGKLLDFGIAKLKDRAPLAALVATSLQTQEPATGQGVLLGTVRYMAPEQLEGKEADARSDIFSFGVVLYEALTGRHPFPADSQASVVAAILEHDLVPASTLQPLTPPTLDRLVQQCLAKAPDDRPDSARDIASELRRLRETSAVVGSTPRTTRRESRRLHPPSVIGGLLTGAIATMAALGLLRPGSPNLALTRVSLDVRPADEMSCAGLLDTSFVSTPGGSRTALAWTPDGRAIVFVGRREGVQRLYVRRLDETEARPLEHTVGALAPAVSADGKWVAFWSGGAIRKVPTGGGPVTDLASRFPDPPWGLAWDARGRLFVGRGSGDGSIWMIPVEGTPTAATKVGKAELAHVLPWPLPDGETLLYTVRKRQWSWGDEEVVAETLATGTRKVLLKDAADARYVPPGHLVFLRRGVLFAVPFDAQRVEVRGTPTAVLDSVAQALTAGNTDYITGAGQFAVASTGALAWVPSPIVPYPDAALVLVNRVGQVSPLPAPVRSYGPATRASADGRQLAVMIRTLADAGVWLYDTARGTTSLLAGGGEAWIPIWSRDGRNLAFEWLENGQRALAVQRVDGTAPRQILTKGDLTVSSFAPDGRHVAAVRESREIVMASVDSREIAVQPRAQGGQYAERWPEFSPDGRWLAFGSDISGRFEVYVRPYPGPGPAEPVSVDGGWSPAWHPAGRELFFVSLPDGEGRRRLMAVDFAPGPPPRIGRPHALFTFDPRQLRFACTPVRCYDVTADGQRFYATETRTQSPPPAITHISLVLNWVEELRTKAPSR